MIKWPRPLFSLVGCPLGRSDPSLRHFKSEKVETSEDLADGDGTHTSAPTGMLIPRMHLRDSHWGSYPGPCHNLSNQPHEYLSRPNSLWNTTSTFIKVWRNYPDLPLHWVCHRQPGNSRQFSGRATQSKWKPQTVKSYSSYRQPAHQTYRESTTLGPTPHWPPPHCWWTRWRRSLWWWYTRQCT